MMNRNVFLVVALVVLLALSGVQPLQAAEPQVTFAADRVLLQPGECTALHWSVQGAYWVKLDDWEVTFAGGKEICPQKPTIYRLTIDAGDKVVSRAVEIMVAGGPGVPPQGNPFADRVVEFRPGNPASERFNDPAAALGPPDFNESALTGFLTLGMGGSVTVEFVDNVAVDGPGPDIEIAGDPENTERWTAEVSIDGISYKSFGKVLERTPLDLAQVSLPYARFVRLTDDGDPSGGISPGAELDTVVALNSAPPDSVGPLPQPLPQPPQPQPPAPPPPPPQAEGADVQPTDIYADNQPQGQIWVRITNNGPATLVNKKVLVTGNRYAFPLSSSDNVGTPMLYTATAVTLNLAPGQTQTIKMGWPIDTSQNRYEFTVMIQPQDFADPNPGNNAYTERVDPIGGPPAPPQPQPQPQPGGGNAVDLAVTDLFSDNLPQGKVFTRVTNNGPVTLINSPVELKCGGSGKPLGNQPVWSAVQAPRTFNISAKPGETVVLAADLTVDTNQYSYNLWCSVWPKAFTESKDTNNKYSETIASGGPQAPKPPPGGGSWGITTADLAVTDLYPDSMPQGKIFLRLTNNGPSNLGNMPVKLDCSSERTEYIAKTKTVFAPGAFTINVTLSPGQTAAFDTHLKVDDSTKYWYKVTCQVKVDFKDPQGGNNSYTASIPPAP